MHQTPIITWKSTLSDHLASGDQSIPHPFTSRQKHLPQPMAITTATAGLILFQPKATNIYHPVGIQCNIYYSLKIKINFLNKFKGEAVVHVGDRKILDCHIFTKYPVLQ